MPSYNNFTKPKFVLTSVAMATGLSLNVNAQTSTEQTQENIAQEVEELIVVGTPGGQGISRQDAAFAVTAISADEISRIAPASSSDLLKNIPGVWVESSGGSAAGANIDVRGLPGGGDTPFVTQSINGSPLFGQSAGISFFATDALVRIDESVVGVEAVRGGPGSVFARGESGLTVNYRLREGSETPESGIKITTALNHDENRIDAYTSGPLSEDDLFYSVAGYERQNLVRQF